MGPVGKVGEDREIPYTISGNGFLREEIRRVNVPLPDACYYSVLILGNSGTEVQYKFLEVAVV